jgi:hypothetical protein
MRIPKLTHWAVAKAQVGLSYLFLLGFFAELTLVALGRAKIDVTSELKEGVMLILFFWFQRQRASGEDPEPNDPNAVPGTPANPTPTETVK